MRPNQARSEPRPAARASRAASGDGLHTASFRFYAELNDFLPAVRRQVTFTHRFNGHPAVKDTIESLGVPHTEIDLILVNEAAATFDTPLKDGDRVSVYPVFESLDISPIARLRPQPLRQPRFVLDVHLGRLAGYLRLLGFDAEYANESDDDELAARSVEDGRILLTRDRGLLKRAAITRGYWVRSTDPSRQIREIVSRFDLAGALAPFTRCIACNGRLHHVAKNEVADAVPPSVAESRRDFTRCETCGRVYWQGSHYERLLHMVRAIAEESAR
jgi:uncharacterized protein with PIN domain